MHVGVCGQLIKKALNIVCTSQKHFNLTHTVTVLIGTIRFNCFSECIYIGNVRLKSWMLRRRYDCHVFQFASCVSSNVVQEILEYSGLRKYAEHR